jgi:hypothetical protein
MNLRPVSAAAAALAIVLACGASAVAKPGPPPPTGGVTVFASGLNNPRGLAFAPDGDLYVAEGGTGGTTLRTDANPGTADSETVPCLQVPAAGPYTGGNADAGVLRIDKHGTARTVVDGLPSSQTSPMAGSLVSGVGAVAFLGGRLYAAEAGAGCSHGLAGTHNGILRVYRNGKTREIVDLSAYLIAHRPLDTTFEDDDWEPDGTWYSMVAFDHALYVTEPNHQVIERVTTRGDVTRVLDMSLNALAKTPKPEWIGPASLSVHDGDLYFGALGPFPIDVGHEQVWKLTPGGRLSVYADGLTAVLGTTWDDRGRLYALESMTAPDFPGPSQVGTGKVVRIDPDGTQTTIVTGLDFPSAIAFGPDRALYISNWGFAGAPGQGEILRVAIPR